MKKHTINMTYKNIFIGILFFFTFFLFVPRAFAVTFDLVAPSGQLSRGGDAAFTINIDTEGASITSTQIGISYETQYLQYVSTVPGNAMTSVTASPTDTGKYLLEGKNSSGFSGKGAFATVNFKIIATAPGSTQLCALWGPTTPGPTAPPPQPTALPKTGGISQTVGAGVFGVGFFIVAAATFIFLKKNEYEKIDLPKKSHHKNQKIHPA